MQQYNQSAEMDKKTYNRISNHCHWASLLLDLCTRPNLLGTGETAKGTADCDRLVKNPVRSARSPYFQSEIFPFHASKWKQNWCRGPRRSFSFSLAGFRHKRSTDKLYDSRRTGPRDILVRRLSDFYVDMQQRSQPSRLTSPDLH